MSNPDFKSELTGMRGIYVWKKRSLPGRILIWACDVLWAIRKKPDRNYCFVEYVGPDDPRYRDAPLIEVRNTSFHSYPP